MDEECVYSSSEGSPQQQHMWWIQPEAPHVKPLQNPIDMLQQFSLSMQLDIQQNLVTSSLSVKKTNFIQTNVKQKTKQMSKISFDSFRARKRCRQQIYCYQNDYNIELLKSCSNNQEDIQVCLPVKYFHK